jgi:hypothetical protein
VVLPDPDAEDVAVHVFKEPEEILQGFERKDNNGVVSWNKFGGLTGAGGRSAPRPNLHWFSAEKVSLPPWPQSHH